LAFASVSSFAAGWANWDDYQAYKTARAAAKEAVQAGDHTTAVAKYKEAAGLAEKAGLTDIQAWQLNNAGDVLIEKFKELVGYQAKLDTLSAMESGKAKSAFRQEVAGIFNESVKFLEDAQGILEEAKSLFPGQATAAADSGAAPAQPAGGPMEKIASNLEFVNWVTEFTAGNAAAPAQETRQAGE
jgi:hypothetical protein